MPLSFLSSAVGGMLALTLTLAWWSDSRPQDTLQRPLDEFPVTLGAWEMKASVTLAPGVLAKLIPTSYVDRQYRKGNSQLELFAAYYASQSAGESMHSPRNCLPGGGWEIWDYGTAKVRVDGTSIDVNKFFIQNGLNRGLVLYWYQTRDHLISDEYRAKAFFIWDRIAKGRTGGSIVRITSTDRPGALEDEQGFAELAIPAMQEILGK